MRLKRAFSTFTVAASMIAGLAVPAIAAATPTTPTSATSHPTGPPSAHGCDPIAGSECLLPFPNDWYTTSAHTPTGRRLALTDEMTPKNVTGKAVDPAAWNISDGFSPGSMLLAQVPGLDLAKTGAAPVTDVGRSLKRDAPIVIVDTRTGERWPYWAELDANATDPARQALIIRPAKNFLEGHHYAVALRDLKDSSGARIAAPATFTRLAGAKLNRRDPLAARQDALRGTLKDLGRAGVGGKGLYLAWDFTVASEQSIAGQVLDMRDDALRGLHGRSPEFTVTSVTDFTPAQDADIAREVKGEFLVPNYLDQPGGPPGSKLNRDAHGNPARFGDDVHAQFQCEIPRAAFTKPSQPSMYGHGLLGSISEVHASNVRAMAGEHDFTFCATAWIGMASEDVANVTGVFGDYSHFDTVVDRLQQSLVDFVFLGRTMITKGGLASDKAFQDGKGHSLIDSRADLVYDGNSQGSIAGGAAVAVSPDVRYGVLGVAGMNYSTLLNRSVDFAPFQGVMDANYPDKLDQQILFALQQILWDRAETDGYAQHLGDDPLPGSPRHRILTQVAFGDHQVANVTAEVEARTMGARIHEPAIAPGRNPDVVPYWGIKALPRGAYPGSAMVVWDSGTPAPPLTNTPPAGEQYGIDPHEDPRADATAREQKAWFLKDGVVVDVCGGRPCTEPHAE